MKLNILINLLIGIISLVNCLFIALIWGFLQIFFFSLLSSYTAFTFCLIVYSLFFFTVIFFFLLLFSGHAVQIIW